MNKKIDLTLLVLGIFALIVNYFLLRYIYFLGILNICFLSYLVIRLKKNFRSNNNSGYRMNLCSIVLFLFTSAPLYIYQFLLFISISSGNFAP